MYINTIFFGALFSRSFPVISGSQTPCRRWLMAAIDGWQATAAPPTKNSDPSPPTSFG